MKKLSTKIFQILLAVSLLFFFILPQRSADALIGDIIKGGTSFSGCVVAGKASPFLSEKINDGLEKLKGLTSKIPGIGKFFGAGGGIVGGDKVPVYDESLLKTYKTKEFTQDVETRCAAIEILNYLNTNITGLARTSGRNGGPAYVRNWRNFQTESQYRGEGIFRAVLSNTKLCNYFDKNIKGLFGATKKTSPPQNTRTDNLDPYALRANCTMPSSFNLKNYQKDFAGNGGWNAWSRMLEPQNNYYGALFGSLDEAAKQRTLEESADLNQVIANKGFTGKSGKDANDSCKTKDASGKCLEYKDIQTPGNIIAEGVAASIKSELDIIISADEVSELISTAVSVLLNRLNNLSDPNEGDYLSPNVDVFDPNDFPVPPPEIEPIEPPPENEPLPEPGTEPSSLLSDLQAERANYGTPMTPAQLAGLLNAVAWKNSSNGWGLLSKPGGNNCPFASVPISCDILFHRPSGLHYDVLIDSEGTGTPTWNLVGPIDISRWVAPVQP